MNITLNKDFESYVNSKVAAGDFNNSTDVVQKALSLLKAQDDKKQALRAELQKGIDAINEGRFSTKTPRQIFKEVLAKREQ